MPPVSTVTCACARPTVEIGCRPMTVRWGGGGSRSSWRRWFCAPLVSIVLLMLMASTADAHPHATIYVSPQNAQPGQSVTLTGVRFWGAVGQATIEWADGTVIGTSPIDANGNWTYTFVLPQGVNEFWRLTALADDASGQPIQNPADPVAVTGPDAPAPPSAEPVAAPSSPGTAVNTPASTSKPATSHRAGHSSRPTAVAPRHGTQTHRPSAVAVRSPARAHRAQASGARSVAAPALAAGRRGGARIVLPTSRATSPSRPALRVSHRPSPRLPARSRRPAGGHTGARPIGVSAPKPSAARHSRNGTPASVALLVALLLLLLGGAAGAIAWLLRRRRGETPLPVGHDPIDAELQALLADQTTPDKALSADCRR